MVTKFSTVAEFLDAQDGDRRAIVDAVRDLVREAAPGAVEIIKWNSPSWVVDGEDRATVNASGRAGVRLILHLGTATPEDTAAAPTFTGDPLGLLTWHSDIRASLAFPDLDSVAAERDAAIAILRRWFASGGAQGG